MHTHIPFCCLWRPICVVCWSHLVCLRGSCQIWLIQHKYLTYNWCKLEILIVMLFWCLSDFFLTMKVLTPPFLPLQNVCRQHYNVQLLNIAVNGMNITSPSVFTLLDKSGGTGGGVIFDSGTTLAYLVDPAYTNFVTAVCIYVCLYVCQPFVLWGFVQKEAK